MDLWRKSALNRIKCEHYYLNPIASSYRFCLLKCAMDMMGIFNHEAVSISSLHAA